MMKKRFPHKSNVLLVNITRLGDMLQATPTIAGMKMENPDCKVTVVVEKQFDGVCKSIPHIDEVMSIDLGMTVRSLAREGEGIIDAYEYVSEFVDELRSRKFDYCLNMSSSAYTAMLLNLIGIKRNGGWSSDEEGYRVIESEWARLFASSVFHQNRQFNSLNLVDVFRCSADVEQHPETLLLDVKTQEAEYARQLIAEAGFTNQGPLIAVQAGASQGKRQWAPANFVKMINVLINKHKARVVLTGTKKELSIIQPIKDGCNSANVFIAAGKTDVPQLAALLKECKILITGDTGTMHISVAVGTPVVSMFLASAFGYETGPYAPGNLILQPVIGCGPCNPNKPCSRPDCHDHIDPEAIAMLTMLRLQGDINSLDQSWFDEQKVIVYKTIFDKFGFYDLQALSSNRYDPLRYYRQAYRKLWLDDLAGFDVGNGAIDPKVNISSLAKLDEAEEGLMEVVLCAQQGAQLITELERLVRDVHAPARRLSEVNQLLGELDRRIEQVGYHHFPLGPLTRMFIFAKENISGTDALQLASQMGVIYQDLERRGRKLSHYYHSVL